MLTLAFTLLVVATPPSNPTPGWYIRRADTGAVVLRRERTSTGKTSAAENITENVILWADTQREDTFEIVRCAPPTPCPPIAPAVFDEENRRERAAAPFHHAVIARLHVAALPSAKNGAKAIAGNPFRATCCTPVAKRALRRARTQRSSAHRSWSTSTASRTSRSMRRESSARTTWARRKHGRRCIAVRSDASSSRGGSTKPRSRRASTKLCA